MISFCDLLEQQGFAICTFLKLFESMAFWNLSDTFWNVSQTARTYPAKLSIETAWESFEIALMRFLFNCPKHVWKMFETFIFVLLPILRNSLNWRQSVFSCSICHRNFNLIYTYSWRVRTLLSQLVVDFARTCWSQSVVDHASFRKEVCTRVEQNSKSPGGFQQEDHHAVVHWPLWGSGTDPEGQRRQDPSCDP